MTDAELTRLKTRDVSAIPGWLLTVWMLALMSFVQGKDGFHPGSISSQCQDQAQPTHLYPVENTSPASIRRFLLFSNLPSLKPSNNPLLPRHLILPLPLPTSNLPPRTSSPPSTHHQPQ
ncbi:hypothetical protein GE09DRAFT_1139057 [Coniochaeta sp. 2T2.1]|nr:hypothetical protein GE09DRAFT_1139057 [Coniochaeta sp. 2T2.1]